MQQWHALHHNGENGITAICCNLIEKERCIEWKPEKRRKCNKRRQGTENKGRQGTENNGLKKEDDSLKINVDMGWIQEKTKQYNREDNGVMTCENKGMTVY